MKVTDFTRAMLAAYREKKQAEKQEATQPVLHVKQ